MSLFLFLPKSWAITPSLKLQGETLNFELSGQKNWDYDLKRFQDGKKTKIQLLVKTTQSISQESLTKLANNPFVEGVVVKAEPVDNYRVIEFTLKTSGVEAFDYLTDQPSKLVVDFYFNEDAKKTDNKESKKAKEKVAVSDKKMNSAKRMPADVSFLKAQEDSGITTFVDQDTDLRTGLFDGADNSFQRFRIKEADIKQSAIVRGLSNYYLKFPMIEQEFLFWKTMKINSPEYGFSKIDTDENKQARLLEVLYNKKRYLVLQKTSKWFEEKYPKSDYLESVYYMNADSMLEYWKQTGEQKYYDQAISYYTQAQTKFPNSVLAERTSLFLAMLTLDKKDYLSAIRKFNTHIENPKFKNKISQDYARLGLALALLKINKLDDALKYLDDVEKNSKNNLARAEAGMRRGDFYFYNQKYDKAVESYDKAIAQYKNLQPLYPSAFFNRMESLFREKKPFEAHVAGLKFVENFPSHEYAPYALTRVGELLEILGADQTKSTGAFLETQFRYGDSPRTVIAQLHLQSLRMKNMKDLEVTATLKKMDELAARSNLEYVQMFKTTKIADGYNKRGDYDKAIDLLTEFYKKDPTNQDANQLTLRIVKNINDKIKKYSNEDNDREVLKQYSKYSDSWLKQLPRIDTDYYDAKSLVSVGDYDLGLKKLNAIDESIKNLKDNEYGKFVKSNQDLPTTDQLKLYKSICLFENNKLQESYDELKSINKPELMNAKEQIKRVYYASLMYEKKGEYKTAIRYLNELIQSWKDQPQYLADSLVKLSDLLVKDNNKSQALSVLNKSFSEDFAANDQKRIYKKMIDLAIDQKNDSIAINALTHYIDKFEKDSPVSTEKYKLGELYFNQGEYNKAEKVWNTLTEPEAQTWYDLAQSKLKESKWQEDNKKYLKRIPAMSNSEKTNEGAK